MKIKVLLFFLTTLLVSGFGVFKKDEYGGIRFFKKIDISCYPGKDVGIVCEGSNPFRRDNLPARLCKYKDRYFEKYVICRAAKDLGII